MALVDLLPRDLAFPITPDEHGGEAEDAALRGMEHLRRRELNSAEAEFRRALHLLAPDDQSLLYGAVWGSLGSIHFLRNEWDESEKCFHQALEIFRRLSDSVGQAKAHFSLGVVYFQQSMMDKAESELRQALSVFEESGLQRELAGTVGCLGSVHYERGDFGQAAEHWHRALDLAEKCGDEALIQALNSELDSAYQQLAEESWREKPSVEAELRYLAEHRSELEQKYPGQWIAIDGVGLVARGRTLRSVERKVEQQGVVAPLVTRLRLRRHQKGEIVG